MNGHEECFVPQRNNVFVDSMGRKAFLIWNKKVPNSQLVKFQRKIEKKYNRCFDSYWDFHQWSVDNFVEFWEEIWIYFDTIASKPYDQVLKKTGPGFLDNDWFSGALMNYAENILRIRDDRIALICADELDHEEKITYREMFEEVSLYSAAFRKMGLTIGDRVACYMSNRKEAVFAMLAATSIGAIWSGPLPYYGARAAAKVIKMLEPKVLISVDSFTDNREIFHPIDNLPFIVNSVSSIEKTIIVTSVKGTLPDTSNILNSVFLEDFLQTGRRPDGTVPDMVFEQLPFSHPICINFTSGTTGLPKGPVHSAGSFLGVLRDVAFHLNIQSGEVIYSNFPVGWTAWDKIIPHLSLGVTLLLFDGSPFYGSTKDGINIWSIFSQYKVTYCFMPVCLIEKLEKMEIFPDPNTNLDHLRVFEIGASPVNPKNIDYLSKIKSDVFVGIRYGATELFGNFSGYDFNSPAFAGESQVPALGVDLKCIDKSGRSIIGQKGDMVLGTPSPSLPIYLWKDKNNEKMQETYLNQYKGVWSQNDRGWINPKTKGFVVIGRTDDTITQYGLRFGSDDIYFAIHEMDELEDYICVCQDGCDGDDRAVLFVKLKKGQVFTPELRDKIADTVKTQTCIYYVPRVILEIPDVPYNLNNKRMESIVRKIIATNEIPDCTNIRNPECLRYFCDIPELVNYCNN